jgi:chemotaxis protein methyltransferase CheR
METLGNRQVVIFASDVDQDALSKAKRGEYQRRQLSTMPQPLVEKFFTQEGDIFTVKDVVKRFVRFEQFDLMNTTLHQCLDLILCRNVMIYFSKEGQQHIHMNFFHALRDGGYFITGKSEMLSGEPSQKFLALDYQTRLYQKPARTSVPLK